MADPPYNESLYRDLRGFLQSPRADIRCEATRAVLDLVQGGINAAPARDISKFHEQEVGDDMRPPTSSSAAATLLENIPDLVSLLAKNCSLASGLNHSDEEEDDDRDGGSAAPSKKNDPSSSIFSARAALHALQALLVLTSDSVGPVAVAASQRCVEQLLDPGSASGMNRMMEILLTAPPPSISSTAGGGPVDRDSDQDPLTLWRKLVNYAMALVANMTRTEEGALELVGRSLPDEAVASSVAVAVAAASARRGGEVTVPASTEEPEADPEQPHQQQLPHRSSEGARLPNKPTVELLLARFLNTAQYADPAVNYRAMVREDRAAMLATAASGTDAALSSHPGDPFQHFASVLMNVTQVEAGRLFVLKIRRKPTPEDRDGLGRTVLQALLPQLKSANPLRRRGVAGTLRNCCLDGDFTWWLLNVVKISTHVLYPLAGPEELDVDEKRGLDPDLWLEGPDKEREVDHLTRLYLVESMLFLASSGRQAQATLRRARVSVILKWAEMVEEQEDVSEKMVECMNLLRDDNQHAEGDERGGDDGDDPSSSIGTPAAAKVVGLSENYDDVD